MHFEPIRKGGEMFFMVIKNVKCLGKLTNGKWGRNMKKIDYILNGGLNWRNIR
jgi:hypothetical protein